jgi:hypothetical protein
MGPDFRCRRPLHCSAEFLRDALAIGGWLSCGLCPGSSARSAVWVHPDQADPVRREAQLLRRSVVLKCFRFGILSSEWREHIAPDRQGRTPQPRRACRLLRPRQTCLAGGRSCCLSRSRNSPRIHDRIFLERLVEQAGFARSIPARQWPFASVPAELRGLCIRPPRLQS